MTVLGRHAVLTLAATLCIASAAQAQLAAPADFWSSAITASPAVGINASKAQIAVGCGSSLLPCRPGQSFAAQASNVRWSVEMGTLSLANSRSTFGSRQGLNLSLVGRHAVSVFGNSFSVYGKFGTTYGMTETAGIAPALASPYETGTGLSFGAGVSMDVTRRLSATLGWDSYETKFNGPSRDLVRATNLGLQYKY